MALRLSDEPMLSYGPYAHVTLDRGGNKRGPQLDFGQTHVLVYDVR